jgi:hypothetical protein
MTHAPQRRTAVERRPKMESAATAKLDQARARVIAAGGPSLGDLLARFSTWSASEVSGRVVKKKAA